MSNASHEAHAEVHESPIKTPTQLIVVLVLAFVVPITVIVLLTQLVTSGYKTGKDDPTLVEEAVVKRIRPVGQVAVADPNAPKVVKSGKEIVETVCAACHASGALNAPKLGDKAAWAKLIAEGFDTMVADSIKGIRQMPARGGNPDLSDTEMARAVAYMGSLAGATWKEPDNYAPAAAADAKGVAKK